MRLQVNSGHTNLKEHPYHWATNRSRLVHKDKNRKKSEVCVLVQVTIWLGLSRLSTAFHPLFLKA